MVCLDKTKKIVAIVAGIATIIGTIIGTLVAVKKGLPAVQDFQTDVCLSFIHKQQNLAKIASVIFLSQYSC